MRMRDSRRWACALLALTLALAPAGCAAQQDLPPVLEAGTPAASAAPSEAAASAAPSAGTASPESAAEAPTATPAATPSATPSASPEAEEASLETGEAGGLDYSPRPARATACP